MCGRFALYSNPKEIAKIFGVEVNDPLLVSYNIAPTQLVPVVCGLPERKRALVSMRWGLVPAWSKAEKKTSLINARFETLESKASFRAAAHRRRCLIIASGFYEWSHQGPKQPYYISPEDHRPIGLAGIWERWVGEQQTLVSCCIITVEANALIAPLHNRMPAIIRPTDFAKWLDPTNENWKEIEKLVVNEENSKLNIYPVTAKMNRVIYNNPDCITPIKQSPK